MKKQEKTEEKFFMSDLISNGIYKVRIIGCVCWEINRIENLCCRSIRKHPFSSYIVTTVITTVGEFLIRDTFTA